MIRKKKFVPKTNFTNFSLILSLLPLLYLKCNDTITEIHCTPCVFKHVINVCCHFENRKNEFRCGSGECLPKTARCDDKFDCRDSSDERECVK